MSHACVNGVVDVVVAMFVHCSLLEHCRTWLSVTCPWLRSATMELYVKCQLCEPCPDKCRDGTNICILHKEKGCSDVVVDVVVAMFVHCSLLEHCRTWLSVTCPWLRSATMELYVKCQLCEPCPDKCRDGTNICILHKEKGCSDFDCGHYIPLSSSGLSCEHTVDAVPDPGEKLDPWVQVRKKLNSIYMQ